MIDHVSGNVFCNECGKFLGNYKLENFYGLINRRYCVECREENDRRRKREWAKSDRQTSRQKINEQTKQIALLKQYTRELEEKCFGKNL